MTKVIDAHHHYWRASTTAEHEWRGGYHRVLDQNFLPENLKPERAQVSVSHTVVVQSADTSAENDRLHEFASFETSIAGIVGYLPVKDPEAAAVELDRADTSWWCGARCLIGDDPLGWLEKEEVLSFFCELAERELAWDVVIINSCQAQAVGALADAVPELRIILDHLARPPIGGEDPYSWQKWTAELAARPNVALKVSVGISALSAWETWDVEALRPSVRHVVQQFGPGRLMLASNWPVSLLGVDYATGWRDLSGLVGEHLNSESFHQVQGGTAERWYRLKGLPR